MDQTFIGSEEGTKNGDIMKDLEKTVQSICATVRGLSDEIVQYAKEREQQENRILSSLDESIAKLRESKNNLHKAMR